jgi:hypothetical protein
MKYYLITGVPPVDYGALMFYNIGEINAGEGNSIYEKSIALKYISSLKSYPLPLDIVLPVFSWGLQIRDGKVVRLLNKMNFMYFENDSNFNRSNTHMYAVRHGCFHGGYYFHQNDKIKIEQVSEDDLRDIIGQVNRYSNHRLRNLIFYDLDKTNLRMYDENIFKQILNRFN